MIGEAYCLLGRKVPPFALVNTTRVAEGKTYTYVFVHQSHWLHNWITNIAVDCAGFKCGWCSGNFPWVLSPWFFVGVPLWFPVAIAAGLATVPWALQIPHRFSLRTLLIVTTLVAVVLGMIVWVGFLA